MGQSRVGRHPRRRIGLHAALTTLDAEERFHVGLMALWLERLVGHGAELTSDLGHALEETLGRAGTNHLRSELPALMKTDAGGDLETKHFENLGDLLRFLPDSLSSRASRTIIASLRRRRREAVGGGKSETARVLASLGKLFRLTPPQLALLTCVFEMTVHRTANRFFAGELDCNELNGRRPLGIILDMNPFELSRTIAELAEMDILDAGARGLGLNDAMTDVIVKGKAGLRRRSFYLPVPRRRCRHAVSQVTPEAEVHVASLLAAKSPSPTHVLLYGPPGTGKTSFVLDLIARLKVRAFEIRHTSENDIGHRRATIRACLRAHNDGEGAVIVVDEADALLNTDLLFFDGKTRDKGWLNSLMDEPGVRIVWIANQLPGLDPSVMRRFSFSLAFEPFTREQREGIWADVARRHRVKRHLCAEVIRELAQRHKVNAGVIETAVRKARESGAAGEGFVAAVRRSVTAYETLRAGGSRPREEETVEQGFSLEGLSMDADPTALLSQIRSFDLLIRKGAAKLSLNLLFCGPPGTGKSELARYLSQESGRELIVRRGSDLKGPYVGETEQKIAAAFREAERENALLVVDEADSFLYSREIAVRSWESSCVNEFLTRMERFRGVLICTTNRYDGLDEAAIRRFTRKIRFDWLTPAGKAVFWERLLLPAAPAAQLDPTAAATLAAIHPLAPGDFRTVRDRLILSPDGPATTAATLLAMLAEEAEAKRRHGEGERKTIGFGC
jgi:AAA+ superfamily predicted ATPase